MTTLGILFVATGEKYVLAAIRAANTVRAHSAALGIHLFTDEKSFAQFNFSTDLAPFSSVASIDDPHRRSKVDYMGRSPFDYTLYLDTDTAFNADLTSMFTILERFDIALAHEHRRNTPNSLETWRAELPQAFPQFNSGVILYRKSPAVLQFLEEWRAHYKSAGIRHDQTTLRELLWLSNLRIATLPPEYNVRYIKYQFIWSKTEASVKIFHLKRFHRGWFGWIFRHQIRKFGKLKQKLRTKSE